MKKLNDIVMFIFLMSILLAGAALDSAHAQATDADKSKTTTASSQNVYMMGVFLI